MKKIIFLFFLILFFKEVSAIGIVTSPLKDGTLKLIEGTSVTYKIQLQNVEKEEIEVRLGLDSEIAEIIDYKEIYTLPKGVSNTPVIFNITAPKNARVNDEYVVSYYVQPIHSGGGPIPIGMMMKKDFKVKIIRNPDKLQIENYLYIAVLIVAVLSLFIKYRKRHKKH